MTTTTIAFYIFNLMYDCLIFHPILLHRFSFTATTFMLVRCTCECERVSVSARSLFSVRLHASHRIVQCTVCILFSMYYIHIHSSFCSMHSSVCLFACRLSVRFLQMCARACVFVRTSKMQQSYFGMIDRHSNVSSNDDMWVNFMK